MHPIIAKCNVILSQSLPHVTAVEIQKDMSESLTADILSQLGQEYVCVPWSLPLCYRVQFSKSQTIITEKGNTEQFT